MTRRLVALSIMLALAPVPASAQVLAHQAVDVGPGRGQHEAGGQRRGFNTDVGGIVAALREAGVTTAGNALVLGSGATACSAPATR